MTTVSPVQPSPMRRVDAEQAPLDRLARDINEQLHAAGLLSPEPPDVVAHWQIDPRREQQLRELVDDRGNPAFVDDRRHPACLAGLQIAWKDGWALDLIVSPRERPTIAVPVDRPADAAAVLRQSFQDDLLDELVAALTPEHQAIHGGRR